MSSFSFGSTSRNRLEGVEPSLVVVVLNALKISAVDITVVEGLRSLERQRSLFKSGKSRTMNSRHLTGHAVDLAPWVDGAIPWEDKAAFDYLGLVMFRSAHDLGEIIEWGGHFGRYIPDTRSGPHGWHSFYDGPHFQIPWSLDP